MGKTTWWNKLWSTKILNKSKIHVRRAFPWSFTSENSTWKKRVVPIALAVQILGKNSWRFLDLSWSWWRAVHRTFLPKLAWRPLVWERLSLMLTRLLTRPKTILVMELWQGRSWDCVGSSGNWHVFGNFSPRVGECLAIWEGACLPGFWELFFGLQDGWGQYCAFGLQS